jgi:hypothetical protein
MRRIKVGVKLYEGKSGYLLGTPQRFIAISSAEEKALALELISGKSEEEIMGIPGANREVINQILDQLEFNQLVDTEINALKVSQRYISKVEERVEKSKKGNIDAALLQLQSRAIPELTQTNWIEGVRDGGIDTLTKRQSYLIEISGQNRVATILYSLLLTSGFSQTRFASDARARKPQIGDRDIGVGTIAPPDLGRPFQSHCESLRKELSLFPLDREHNYLDELSTPDLIIYCGEIDPEKFSHWMSTGQNFLHIPTPHAGTAEIGPLVIPGKSPCHRCAALVAQEQSQIQPRFEGGDPSDREYPQIAAHFIAAITASFIADFFDLSKGHNAKGHNAKGHNAKQELVGTVVAVDYQSLSRPRSTVIPRHPLCGCAFQ